MKRRFMCRRPGTDDGGDLTRYLFGRKTAVRAEEHAVADDCTTTMKIGESMPELKVEGSLLKNITKATRACTGYGLSKQEERRKAMADLFKDFQDWLAYNHPEVKLEPLQEDLMRVALRHWSKKVTKAGRKAVLKELTQYVMFAETKRSP